MKFVCKEFYGIVCNYKIYRVHKELPEQIICKISVSNSFRKHLLSQNFSFLFRSDIVLIILCDIGLKSC